MVKPVDDIDQVGLTIVKTRSSRPFEISDSISAADGCSTSMQTNETNKRSVDGVPVERLAEEGRVKRIGKFYSAEAGVASAEPRCEQQSPPTRGEPKRNWWMRRAILNAELLHLHFRWSEGRPRSGNDLLDRLYLAGEDIILGIILFVHT